MGHSDIVDYARNFAVMVRIRGPVSFSVSLSGSGQTQCCIIMVTQLAISVTLLSGPKRDEDEKTRFSSIPVRRPIHYLILFVSQSFVFFCTYGCGGFLFSFWVCVLCSSGETALSTSGLLVPDTLCDTQVARRLYGDNCEGRVLVVTVASVVEPFLSPQQRENIPQVVSHEFSNLVMSKVCYLYLLS